jgi:hypothetical protein
MEGRAFWKKEWGLGKDKMILRKGNFWKVVGIGRRRSKWILGRIGRLRMKLRLEKGG